MVTVLGAAVAVLVHLESDDGLDAAAGTEPAQAAASGPAHATAAYTPNHDHIARLSAKLLARPLFSPARRPTDATGLLARDPAPSVPRLTGIIVTSAGRQAIFAGPGGKPVVLREGDRFGAFSVQAIRPGQVVLSGPDGTHALGPTFEPGMRSAQSFPVALPGFPLPPGNAEMKVP